MFSAIDWTRLTDSIGPAFEHGVEVALPVAGVILSAFIVFKAIRRFLADDMGTWERDHEDELQEYERGERDSVG